MIFSLRIQSVSKGLIAAWPICLGYVPIGLAFGVLAQKAGLTSFQIGLMSLFVFAGSSQFIAVSMLSAGSAVVPIVLTTFMVNLRHLLMSSALSVYLNKEKRSHLTLFAYGVTDESFGVNLSRFQQMEWRFKDALVVNHTANAFWIISTICGGFGGRFISEGAFGIDYALIAMFICLLVYQLKGRKYVITGLISGSVAVLLSILIPGNSYIVLASVIAATLGIVLEKHIEKEKTPCQSPNI